MRSSIIIACPVFLLIVSGFFMLGSIGSLMAQEKSVIDSILLANEFKADELAQLKALPVSSVTELTNRINAVAANSIEADRLFQQLVDARQQTAGCGPEADCPTVGRYAGEHVSKHSFTTDGSPGQRRRSIQGARGDSLKREPMA